MNSHRASRGRSSAVALVLLASLAPLAGCSSPAREILGPSAPAAENVVRSAPSEVLAPPLVIDRWKSPRITVWTDGWRRVQRQPGVSLDPSRVFDFDLPAQQPVTFHWSARPMSAQGEIVGYRWAVDMEDILDETPRSGPDDVAHWSEWSAVQTSATVGPFDAGPDSPATHFFFLEARDNLGFVSLFTVGLQVVPASI